MIFSILFAELLDSFVKTIKEANLDIRSTERRLFFESEMRHNYNSSDAVQACLSPVPCTPRVSKPSSRSGTPLPVPAHPEYRFSRSRRASPMRTHSLKPYATEIEPSSSNISQTRMKHGPEYESTSATHHRGIIFPSDSTGSPRNVSGRRLLRETSMNHMTLKQLHPEKNQVSTEAPPSSFSRKGPVPNAYSDSLVGGKVGVLAQEEKNRTGKYFSASRGTTPVPWGSECDQLSSSRHMTPTRGTPMRGRSPFRPADSLNIFSRDSNDSPRYASPTAASVGRTHFLRSHDSVNVIAPQRNDLSKEVQFRPSRRVLSEAPPFEAPPKVITTPRRGPRAITPASTQPGGHNFVAQGLCVTSPEASTPRRGPRAITPVSTQPGGHNFIAQGLCVTTPAAPTGRRQTLEAMRAAAPAPRNAPLPQ